MIHSIFSFKLWHAYYVLFYFRDHNKSSRLNVKEVNQPTDF